jgi:ABC-type phosphate transport system substrate-binding protein
MKYILGILFIFFCFSQLTAQVAVIAHKDVPVEEISKTLLYDFYSGDIQEWENGEEVIVLDLKPKSEIKDEFYEFLGTSTSRMKSVWLKKMLAGEKDPPASCETEEKMITNIAQTPGSIGFISNENLTDEVKLLLVIEND